MSETVDDVRHRMKRLLEMSPDRMDFKMGDMCCEFMLSAYDQVVTELDSERDALRCCKGEYTRLKRDFDELKQQLEEACAARDQWRKTHSNLKTALDALKFYADLDNWESVDKSRSTGNKCFDIILFDFDRNLKPGKDYAGKKARQAIAQIESGK